MSVADSVVLVSLIYVVKGSLEDITTPLETCVQVNANGVNVRDGACGIVIGQTYAGYYYTAGGQSTRCDLSGVNYDFHLVHFNGQNGWIAGEYLDLDRTSHCASVPVPDNEWRGIWIATVYNIDWPSSSTISPQHQQDELVQYLNMAAELNFNAVVFQVRPVGDAMYSSNIEPWSRYLTGTQGTAPEPRYDPLTFLCEQAHARDIEVHVWLNPYRANMAPNTDGLASNHMAIQFPQYAYPYGSYLWMDPGAQQIIDRLTAVIDDIIRRYDVDGIHFDDYFYPYPKDGVDFPDDSTYNDYVTAGGTLSRENWRRDNVNRMVERVWNSIQELNADLFKTVKFSISPFGIYRPGHEDGMPAPIVGLDPYTAMFADSKLWVQEGWVDFLVPQLYWNTHIKEQSYPTLLDWWCNVGIQSGVQIYAGNGLYRLDSANGDWPTEEFGLQVDISRALRETLSLGNCQYSARYLNDDVKGITSVFQSLYPTKAGMPYHLQIAGPVAQR